MKVQRHGLIPAGKEPEPPIMKKIMVFLLIASSLLLINCGPEDMSGELVLTDCPVEIPIELLESGKFSYGYMKVPEIAANPDGRTIELAVAVFKCQAESSTHEPLVLCAGGPGSSNIDTFVPALTGGLGKLFLNNRDVVVIESRGLKYSRPNLILPGFEELQISLLDKNLTADETIDLYLDKVKSSYDQYTEDGVNLSAFNSLEISNEIAYVMDKLEYPKFSMFGTSYGTMVAQYLLMNHSDRLAAVVMNGTMDFNRGGYHMHTSLVETLDSIFEKCRNDPSLNKAYPDLKSRFLELIKRLNEHPETIEAQYAGDGKTYEIALNGSRLSLWLFHQMYANTQIPLTIHKLVSGDYSEIIKSPGMIFPLPDFSMGLSLCVFLSETPDIKPEDIPVDGEYSDLIKGTATTWFTPYFWNQAKDIWKVDAMPADKSFTTDVPILMFSGEMDYLCLPSYAKEFAAKQKNAHLYIFKGVAHSPIDVGECGIMMMKQFLDNPAEAPDGSCVDKFTHEYLLPEQEV